MNTNPPETPAKKVETTVLTKEELQAKNILLPNPDGKPFAGVALAAGEVVAHKWHDSTASAALWCLERSAWEYR